MNEVAPVPDVSIVIPTFNRRARLERVLQALAAQTAVGSFEVVVVSDGSTDGTDDYLSSGSTPLPVQFVSQPNGGPAEARNTGIRAARGRLVLFIDDDVIPADDLVERHVAAHADHPDDVVVIGPMLTPHDAALSPWVAWEQHQLYKQYEAMRRGDYAPTFRQFYTGNASASRLRLVEAGMFDTRFRRAEDVELAFRLDAAGLSFVFDESARGYHYAERSFESWAATPFEYGRNDVAFMRSGQQWMTDRLPAEFRTRHLLVRSLVRVCVGRPRTHRVMTAALRVLASSRVAVGPLRRQVLSGIYNTAYYQGLATALGSRRRFFDLMNDNRSASAAPRASLVLEQTLGHVTHSDNLRTLLADESRLHVTVLPVPYETAGLAAKIPGFGNWTIRAGLRARRLIRRTWNTVGIDVMFIHTQVPAVLAGRWLRKVPTVVSLDATPAQYDQLGSHYAHELSSPRVESLKKQANVRTYRNAARLVAWSEWTRQGLVDLYGVDADKVDVIAPGVHVERWQRPAGRAPGGPASDGPVRVLFVGGDLDRKGGRLLIDAAAQLRTLPEIPPFELHLVTRTPVDAADVIVHDSMRPNSPELIDLYHRSHIFCLPTLGDCLPMVLSEAGVAGMALISTDVGAISEIVRHDETGLLIPPGDLPALTEALRRLIVDAELRGRLGTAAEALVRKDYDARVNADRLVTVLVDLARAAGER